MSGCTWEHCDKPASIPKYDSGGELWANLCDEHSKKLEDSVGKDPRHVVACWVKAQGGPKKAARRMSQQLPIPELAAIKKSSDRY